MPIDAMQHRENAGLHRSRQVRATQGSSKSVPQDLAADIRHFAAELSHISQVPQHTTRSSAALNDARPSAMATAVRLMLLLNQVRQSPDADLGDQSTPVLLHNEAAPFSPSNAMPPMSAVTHARTSSADAETHHRSDAWLLTGASAMPASSTRYASTQETATTIGNMRIVRDEQEKGDLIRALKQALVQSGWLDIRDAENFEFSLRTSSSGVPLTIVPLETPPDELQRTKRMAQDKIDEGIARHIANHCAMEEEVLNANGENEGKILLYDAQRTENLFRRLYDGHDSRPPPETRGLAGGLNTATDLLSFGVKPLITSLIANAKRSEYYQSRGDMICADRYKHLSLATLATSLDIDGLALTRKALPRKAKPAELQHALPTDKNAAYFTRNPVTGIRREILLRVRVDDSGNEIFLKPSGRPNEYLTHHPHAQRPELLERRVVVDEKTMRWRYADDFDTRELNVDMQEGKYQISLHGEHYDLQRNAANKYEIVVRQVSGEVSLLPVYMEPLSRTWHLGIENAQPVFTSEQTALLERVSHTPNDDFYYIPSPSNNERSYGGGLIYRTEKKDDSSHYTYGTFVEMDGRLVPVTTRITSGHGLHYEVVDPMQAGGAGRPIAFDGARWRFEADSAPQVSKEVKRLITPDMVVHDIQPSQLSVPDAHGLKWDMQDKAYLKVDGSYIRITRLNANRFAIHQSDGRLVILRFREGKFFEEHLNERLHNLLDVGLNGHKRKTPEALLEDCGMTPENARALLAEYEFPCPGPHGLASLYCGFDFALYVHEHSSLPPWAERFKRPRMEQSHRPENGIATVADPDSPDNTLDLKLGAKLGEGYWGEVYVDADDPNYVIKRFRKFASSNGSSKGSSTSTSTDEIFTAPFEAEVFRRYYGEDSATVYVGEDDEVNYIRMLRVPGTTIGDLPAGSLPSDAIERYADMIGRLEDCGIWHGDLTVRNVLWDGERFNPIDMQDIRERYFALSNDEKAECNDRATYFWETMMEKISGKMRRAPDSVAAPNLERMEP
ncbi:hypothetical protein ACQUFY_25195 (plasmid) [Robbsia andropogonis]|uniref:OspG family effector kinase n=1 Tax=Robbsia andropogonis TaxID=28092 RepID=UPI003D1F414D